MTVDGHGAVGSAWAVPAVGTQLGRYTLLEQVGAGAMGIVYAARDRTLDRRVALKLIVPSAETSDAARRRFIHEARMLAAIDHPNVVGVYDLGHSAGRIFIVMPLLTGRTLRQWLTAERSPSAVQGMFEEIAAGLQAAHALGIVHGDLKPDNVLLNADGRPMVADFGLARLVAPTTEEQLGVAQGEPSESARAGAGTPAYMAPEQHEGAAPSAASDQYAFFTALFEALTGHRPFRARTHAEALIAKRQGLGRRGLSEVPRGLRASLRRGLEPEPAQRFPRLPTRLAADRHRRWWAGAAASCGLLALLGAARAEDPAPADCVALASQRAAELLIGVESLTSDGAAAETLTHNAARIERWSARWESELRATCEAALVPAASQQPRRTRCLERQHARVRERIADRPSTERLADMLAWSQAFVSLPDPEDCESSEGPDEGHPRAAEFEGRLANVSALLKQGRGRDATALALSLQRDAELWGDQSIVLGAKIGAADGLSDSQDFDPAMRLIEEVLAEAEATGRFELATKAGVQQVWISGVGRHDLEAARRAVKRVEANAARAGDAEHVVVRAMGNLAAAYEERGELENARAQHARILERTAAYRSDPRLERARRIALVQALSLAAKLDDFRSVRELAPDGGEELDRFFGPHAMNSISVRAPIAHSLGRTGHYTESIELFELLADRLEQSQGPTSFWAAQMHTNAAHVELFRGEPARAHKILSSACPAMTRARSPRHSNVLVCELLQTRAAAEADLPVDLEAARERYGMLAARYDAAHNRVLQYALIALAYAELRQGELASAQARVANLEDYPTSRADGLWISGRVSELRGQTQIALTRYTEVCELASADFRPELCAQALRRRLALAPSEHIRGELERLRENAAELD